MELLELEKIASAAASAVSALMDDSAVDNDGGGDYVYLPVECKNIDAYIIAFVPTLENGADAKWQAQDNDYNECWDSEELDASSDPERVAEWLRSVVDSHAARIDAGTI